MDNNDILCVCADTFLRMPFIDTSVGLSVTGDGKTDEIKSKLLKLYGQNATVTADGKAVKLIELKHAQNITVAALADFDKPRYNVIDAKRIIRRLMQKPGGCPWDSVQTHESIRVNMIEEAYEAVDAIDKKDIENMKEEFGDVLLQSLLQSEIAKRDGEFDFDDVCDGLCKKLITRHTFIFGGDDAKSADDAITLWEKNKAVEKHYTTLKEQLERLPENFPSLLRLQKVYKKTKKAGRNVDPMAEYEAAVAGKDYVGVIAACAALLAEEGKDAEVELNAVVSRKIGEL